MKIKLLNIMSAYLVVFIVTVSAHSMNEVLTNQEAQALEQIVIEDIPYTDNQITCLADNIYHEARGQGKVGWLAVAFVTVNRMNDNRYPDTICGVVHQAPTRESWKKNGKYYPIRNKCQFSWYCDGKADTIHNKKLYDDIYTFIHYIMTPEYQIDYIDITDGATHYHADYVTPAWAETKTKTAEIGDHIFYRWETK